ncbi:MAG: polysaccharide pyruvyl transferase family protein, partial [Planctomycetota bacterium]
LSGPAPQAAGYTNQSIRPLLARSAPGSTSLMIGGGDLLRTDGRLLATHYTRLYERWRSRWLNSGGTDLAEEFSRRFFPANGAHLKTNPATISETGPFLLDARAYPALKQLFYVSCGVPFDFSLDEAPAVCAAMESAALVYVRDEPSRAKLRAAGVARPIEVAPDMVVTLSDLFSVDHLRAAGRAWMRVQGVDTTRPIVCFQSYPLDNYSADLVIQQLKEFQQQSGGEVVLLPVGHCHDDQQFLRHIAHYGYGRFHYLEESSVRGMLAVLAGSDYVAATSLHANITAFALGIPHLCCSSRMTKVAGFLEQVGLPESSLLVSWSKLAESLGALSLVDHNLLQDRVVKAKRRVHDVIGQLATALTQSPALRAA